MPKVEAVNWLGYTRPSRTSLPSQWNRNFKTGVSLVPFSYAMFFLVNCRLFQRKSVILTLLNLLIKKNIEEYRELRNSNSEEDSRGWYTWYPCDTFWEALYKLVPGACFLLLLYQHLKAIVQKLQNIIVKCARSKWVHVRNNSVGKITRTTFSMTEYKTISNP